MTDLSATYTEEQFDAVLDRWSQALSLAVSFLDRWDEAQTLAEQWHALADRLAASLRVSTVAGPRPDIGRLQDERIEALAAYNVACRREAIG
jgi:hypothetical protein